MTVRTALNATEVAAYLAQYPDFFHNHTELLETLSVSPPQNGKTVSLLGKQLELARNKCVRLEQQLNTLINIARHNDASLQRLHQFTLRLLSTHNIVQVLHQLQIALAEFFITDLVVIRLLYLPSVLQDIPKIFLANDESAYLQGFAAEWHSTQPMCGALNKAQLQLLFPSQRDSIKSCALMPLVYPQLKALLAVGSPDPLGFHAGMGNIFLTHISAVVATRLISLLPSTHDDTSPQVMA